MLTHCGRRSANHSQQLGATVCVKVERSRHCNSHLSFRAPSSSLVGFPTPFQNPKPPGDPKHSLQPAPLPTAFVPRSRVFYAWLTLKEGFGRYKKVGKPVGDRGAGLVGPAPSLWLLPRNSCGAPLISPISRRGPFACPGAQRLLLGVGTSARARRGNPGMD